MDAADPGGHNPLYYLAPYSYVGLSGAPEAPHPNNVLTATASSDSTPFAHNPPQFFDASSVVFSDASIVQHGTGSGGLPTPPGAGSDDSQLRSGVFYH